ncbi:SDR family oxidoreductase [Glycomyces sp. TRM65418]|uniref:SDR family oxidoreductase n=1 Tax=Glycomyces sp. TRM65418 TaxID=2867006 RepID=UPI001CE701DC|nr:SDR family oxidoreductase [Glycomyces sp. TRM65418]MCC3762272.1 SDR family oxidoreductase [Glycomyces sp. TRM65418]QZD56328.1 SDR family oxidoreductase [Glycomyces sp. TRM65418]
MSKTILVTGAGRGLGRTLAAELTARGDRVIAHARSESALEGVPHEAKLILDLAEPAAIADAVRGIGRLDAIIHNAGIAHIAPVAEQRLEWWERTLTVNVTAPAELTRALLPALRAARGHVVFVNSGAGLTAGPKWSSYAASKHALKALANALRGEEQGNGVRVTSVYPSHFDTDMQRSVREQYGSDYDRTRATSPESIAKTIADLLHAPEDMVVNELRIEPPNPLPIQARSQ